MKHAWLLIAIGLLITCALLLGAASAAPPQAQGASPQAHPVVLICPDLVDILWDPSQFATEVFTGELCAINWGWYIIRRGPDPYAVKTQSALGKLTEMQGFYRDETVAQGQTYWYDTLQEYECPTKGSVFAARKLGSTPVTISEHCYGAVAQDLTFSGGVLDQPALVVWKGAKLTLAGTTVRGGRIVSAGDDTSSDPPGGVIQVLGATLEGTELDFTATGDNHLRNSNIYGDLYQSEVHVGTVAEVNIASSHFHETGITIEDAPQVLMRKNRFHQSMLTLINLQAGLDPDRIRIDGNYFYDASQSVALWQYGGGSTIVGNVFQTTEEDSTKDAIHVDGSLDTPKKRGAALIRHNKITGYNHAIALGEKAVVTASGNLIWNVDDGLFLRYDAQVEAWDNTIRDNEQGLYVWDDATVTLHDSCIAGNQWGVRTSSSTGPLLSIDARHNWWGHSSGPEHVSNPAGQGDLVASQAIISDPLVMDNCIVDLTTDVISATGGTVSTEAGDTTVSLPAGAVSADTRVAIKPRDPAAMANLPNPPQGLSPVRLFDVSAEVEASGAPVTQLNEQAAVTEQLTQQEAARVDKTTLATYRLSNGSLVAGGEGLDLAAPLSAGQTWVSLPTEVDAVHNVLTATTETLGTFAVLAEFTAQHVYLPLVIRTAAW